MSFELELKEDLAIAVRPGQIAFKDYELLMGQATQVARMVSEITVTEENIKETKKVLANVNKSIKRLNDMRISIKKEMLEPYDIFAQQVKDIEGVVLEADTKVRSMVREMEELERVEKDKQLREVWDKRVGAYKVSTIVSYDDWKTEKHLNKSFSMKNAEQDMVNWMEQVESDVAVLAAMEPRDELIRTYLTKWDLGSTIQAVQEFEKTKQELNKAFEEPIKEDEYLILIKGEQTFRFVELLLKENKILYEVK